MKLEAINHIPKSHMAYALDEDTLSITIQTARNDVDMVKLIIGDPFDWRPINGKFQWAAKSFPHQEMEKTYFTELFDYFNLEVLSVNRRSKYAFLIYSGDDIYFYGCRDLKLVDLQKDEPFLFEPMGYFNFPYINKEDLIDSPDWSKNTIWYQIFPDRFNKSKNNKGNYVPFSMTTENLSNHTYYGGDLLGVVEKIPYLKDLGITGIYFTPIFKAYSVHKYDTEDYFQIDPTFGTNDDFKCLVDECHKAGIKIMLDAVFNHCGYMHPFFQDVIKNKKKSKYWDCFYIEDEDFINFDFDEFGRPKHQNVIPKYKTFAFTPNMPKLNTSHPIMEEYLLDVASYWIEKYDIDGWRLDVSNEVSHSFWRKFKSRVRSIKSDIYILGENWDDSQPWLLGDQLDAVMNYSLSYLIWTFFGKSPDRAPYTSKEFVQNINRLLVGYPKSVNQSMFNLIDSHDTMRILSRLDNNIGLMKLAYLFIFTFPGSPVILYGDEIGLNGRDPQEARRCMIWNASFQNTELKEFFKKLIKLRINYPEFMSTKLVIDSYDDNLLSYKKDKLIILINNSNELKTIRNPHDIQHSKVVDLMSNHTVSLVENTVLHPYDFRIYYQNKNR